MLVKSAKSDQKRFVSELLIDARYCFWLSHEKSHVSTSDSCAPTRSSSIKICNRNGDVMFVSTYHQLITQFVSKSPDV